MNNTATAVIGKNVSFRYQNSKNNVIDCCSFSFNHGEITAVVGKNGEGKTTLGKLCASILQPTSGDVFLYGKNTKTIKLSDVSKELCYCFQSPSRQLFADTAEEEIAFALKYKKIPKKEIDYIVDKMLNLFGLNEVRKSYPLRLSGGEQQRLAIAAGLALKPKFLLLDEPTSGLDKARIDEFSAMLKKLAIENHMGIAIISHDKDFVAASANRILCVKEGKVYAQ